MSGAGDWLGARAHLSPEANALESGGERLDYAQLDARVAARAVALRAHGVRPGDRVALLLRNGTAFVESVHAVWRCGAIALPLSWRWRPSELAHALADAEPALLVHGEGVLARVAGEAAAGAPAAPPRLAADDIAADPADDIAADPGDDIAADPADAEPFAPLAPDADCALLYTSGTSGAPKGALLTRAGFEASAFASAERLGAPPDERWLACMPLFHVGGLSILVRSVLLGGAAIVHEGFDAGRVNDALDHDAITLVSLVPTMLERLLAARGGRPAPPGLRCVLLGGAAAAPGLIARAEALGFPVAPTYGLTEATSQVATFAPGPGRSAAGAALAPLPGCELRVVDANDRPLAPGVAGEIVLRGATRMRGYWRRPDASAEALRGGWLHTGDVGTLDADGALRVLERRSDLIVSGGENVYPAEIEQTLERHPHVAEAAVVARADREWGQRPVAWVVRRPGAPADAEALLRFCRERLAGFKVPVALCWSDTALPRTASGKLLRRALAER